MFCETSRNIPQPEQGHGTLGSIDRSEPRCRSTSPCSWATLTAECIQRVYLRLTTEVFHLVQVRVRVRDRDRDRVQWGHRERKKWEGWNGNRRSGTCHCQALESTGEAGAEWKEWELPMEEPEPDSRE